MGTVDQFNAQGRRQGGSAEPAFQFNDIHELNLKHPIFNQPSTFIPMICECC